MYYIQVSVSDQLQNYMYMYTVWQHWKFLVALLTDEHGMIIWLKLTTNTLGKKLLVNG